MTSGQAVSAAPGSVASVGASPRRTANAALAALPFNALVALARATLPLVELPVRRLGAAPPPYRNPTELGLPLSDAVFDAIERVGGGRAVLRSLRRLDRVGNPTALAVMVKGLDRAGGRVEVHGYHELRSVLASGRPVILLEPHIGPFQLIAAHLLLAGERVGGFSAVKHEASEWYRRALLPLVAPPVAGFEEIAVSKQSSALRAIRLLRSGGVLVWNPLVFSFMGRSEQVPVRFLGLDLLAAPTLPRLARQTGAELFVASARLLDSREGPRVRIVYERATQDPAPPPEDDAERLRAVYRFLEHVVLDNVDQWFGWRWLPSELARVAEREGTDMPTTVGVGHGHH